MEVKINGVKEVCSVSLKADEDFRGGPQEGGICQVGGRQLINTMKGLSGADGEGFQGDEVAGWCGGAVAWMGLVYPTSTLSRRSGSGARHASHCRGRQGATCGGLLEAAQCCDEEHRLPNQLFVTLQPVI